MGFMTKDPKVRLDDTVDYIAGRVPVLDKPAVEKYLTDWLTRSIGADPKAKAFKDYSNSLTMTNVKNPGDKAEREKRRALMLMESMKAGANPTSVAAIKTMAALTLDTKLTDALEKVRIAADETDGTGLSLQTIFLTDVVGSTRRFLQNNRLLEGGIAAGDEAYFFYEYNKNQFRIEPRAPGNCPHAYRFDTVSVPAVVWSNVPGRTNSQTSGSFAQIVGTELTGADAMISTQFSGCSFCFKVVGTRIFAAHIMPDDGAGSVVTGGGAALARQLAGQVNGITGGDFAAPCPGGGQFFVYGAGYSNLQNFPQGYPVRTALDQYMNIFGKVKNNVWRIYSQHVLNNTNTAVRIY